MLTSIRQKARDGIISTLGRLRKNDVPSVHIIAGHFVAREYLSSSERLNVLTRFYDSLMRLGDLRDIDTTLSRIVNRDLPSNRSLISLTFDDGFEECEDIANFFDKKDIKVTFFINSGCIEASSEYYVERYNRMSIKDKKFLSWNALRDMQGAGHTIGGHTFDHIRLNTSDDGVLERQIIADKNNIDAKLGGKCKHFAWPYGTNNDVSRAAIRIATNSYEYVFSSCDYGTYYGANNKVFNRRHLEPNWRENHIKYFLSNARTYS